MKKRESKLWQRIKNLNLKGQIFRIESNTINGIPDCYWLLNGKSFWIELKSNDIKNCGLSKFQINWHIDHIKNGGNAFILQEGLLQSKLKLFKVRETRKLDILAEGENSRDTLELHFDKMAWDEGIETGVLKK
jgi:hypothetical protein